MTEPKRYYIRFAEAQDHPKIMQFYIDHSHPNVRRRHSEVVGNLAEKGAVILVEDETGNIVASSITYPHMISISQGDGAVDRLKWQEIGSTHIVSINGYEGLFDTMITMQTLHAWLVGVPDNCFVAQMKTIPLQKMAEKLGWLRCEPSQALLDSKADTINQGDALVSKEGWFCCGEEGLSIMARAMLHVLNDPMVPHRNNPDDKIVIDFSRNRLVAIFEDEIRSLAMKNVDTAPLPPKKMALSNLRDKIMIKKLGKGPKSAAA